MAQHHKVVIDDEPCLKALPLRVNGSKQGRLYRKCSLLTYYAWLFGALFLFMCYLDSDAHQGSLMDGMSLCVFQNQLINLTVTNPIYVGVHLIISPLRAHVSFVLLLVSVFFLT